jgi:hypothetical protein
MPYNRQIPDSPIPGSMLPRASELTLADLLLLIQPGNPIGQRNKSLTLEQLSNFLKSVFEDKLAVKELDILGNEDSTAQIPKVSGWKLVTDTDVTSPTYGQLIVTCETTPGAYPVDKPNVVNFPHITIGKLHATGAATFEKDVTIDADLNVAKTVTFKDFKPQISNLLKITDVSQTNYTYEPTEQDTQEKALSVPAKIIVNASAIEHRLLFAGPQISPGGYVSMNVVLPVGYAVTLIPVDALQDIVTGTWKTLFAVIGGMDKNLYTP